MYLGARTQKFVPAKLIKGLLAVYSDVSGRYVHQRLFQIASGQEAFPLAARLSPAWLGPPARPIPE